MFEEHITMEELVRFISSRFAPEERDTLIGMISAIGLSIESSTCHGEVIRDDSRSGNKYICTSCGNSYRTKQRFCTFTILRRIPVEPLVDITPIQQKHKQQFKCETCKFPTSTKVCPLDHQECIRVKKVNKTATKYGNNCSTLEEYNEFLAKQGKS
jgi:hypothetical protein